MGVKVSGEVFMLAPALPPDEGERLQELVSLHLLDTPAEERFDRLTRLATKLFNVPVALISLVDSDRVWFKSAQGLSASESPREISFCAYAILDTKAMIVPDTFKDERFKDNPFVKGEPHIRFYAGHPLTGPKGHRLGVLCLIDDRPRELDENDLSAFSDLAALVESELGVVRIHQTHQELLRERDKFRSQALVDSLTRLWNRGAILEILYSELKKAEPSGQSVGIILADLDHFKSVNDTFGHPVGDVVLVESAQRIRSCLRASDAAGRYGGEEFMILLPGADQATAAKVAERIRQAIGQEKIVTPRGIVNITMSLGVGVTSKGMNMDMDMVVAQVDKALYSAKRDGRNQVGVCTFENPLIGA